MTLEVLPENLQSMLHIKPMNILGIKHKYEITTIKLVFFWYKSCSDMFRPALLVIQSIFNCIDIQHKYFLYLAVTPPDTGILTFKFSLTQTVADKIGACPTDLYQSTDLITVLRTEIHCHTSRFLPAGIKPATHHVAGCCYTNSTNVPSQKTTIHIHHTA
jgi:hypothetical protein